MCQVLNCPFFPENTTSCQEEKEVRLKNPFFSLYLCSLSLQFVHYIFDCDIFEKHKRILHYII